MRTLTPAQTFLRVVDKIFSVPALENSKLCAGAELLYLNLFLLAGQRDTCAPSRAALARACKSSKRAVQRYLHQLASLGYVRIERDGTRSVYHLLLSTHFSATEGVAL